MAKNRKTGGILKGGTHHARKSAAELAERLGVDPMEVLLNIVSGNYKALGYKTEFVAKISPNGDTVEVDRISLDMRLQAAKEACKYLHSQLKAVEVKNAADDVGFKVIIEDYTE